MKKQVWSKDNEFFQSDSKEDLICDYRDQLEVGSKIFEGTATHPSPCFMDASDAIEYMQERAYDEYGEYAESFLDGLTSEAKQELEDFLEAWQTKYGDVTFYNVSDVVEHIITDADLIFAP